MAQQTINIGTTANDGTGDAARIAFDKVNDNFTELFAYFMTTLDVNLASLIAGERNADSATASYLVVRKECNASIIGKTTAVTIGAGAANDTHLIGLVITAALTGTCVITGFADSDGTATSITFPAATPAGFKDFYGAINSAGAITVTCSNASDDNLVTVLWRPV